ncbi:MAG: alpha/beta hydrolase [Candidatus Loosdrechtia sp.]|uniref:alpha/beta hydrolase n=1 Tax=Candidatus Loosdrechtia sp. TaxID=3101272 RepID=UPI003A786490|nr:MAG: dienelactone hydrolase family protein [Candidatus Jettenia sp. AMX2]
MIEEYVHFASDDLNLEGVLTYNGVSQSSPSILLCAPHPILGGNMDNNVIMSLAQMSVQMGFMSLRFNYRGVGNSESREKDIVQRNQRWEDSLHGEGYLDAFNDVQAALNFLISQTDRDEIFIAGYSFGAVVGMRVGMENSHVKALASISVPFGPYNLDFLRHCKKEKLFLYSENDFAVTTGETLKGFLEISSPKILELVQGTDHFYRGYEDYVSQKICKFFISHTQQ